MYSSGCLVLEQLGQKLCAPLKRWRVTQIGGDSRLIEAISSALWAGRGLGRKQIDGGTNRLAIEPSRLEPPLLGGVYRRFIELTDFRTSAFETSPSCSTTTITTTVPLAGELTGYTASLVSIGMGAL